ARFDQPIRLRDRVRVVRDKITSVPPKPAIAVSIGAVAVGAGAFSLGWWWATRRLLKPAL
ncbi:MAG: hypothetical protein ACRD0B_07620, partial [Acidimicrobiales bacterium]